MDYRYLSGIQANFHGLAKHLKSMIHDNKFLTDKPIRVLNGST